MKHTAEEELEEDREDTTRGGASDTCHVTYDKSVAVISSRRNATQYWPRPSPSLSAASRFLDGFNVRLLPERERESVSFPLSTTMAIEREGEGGGGPSGPCEEIPAINPRLLTLTGSLPPHLLAPDSGKRCYRRSNAIHQQALSLATRARAPLVAAFFSLLSLSPLNVSFLLKLCPLFSLPVVLEFPIQG